MSTKSVPIFGGHPVEAYSYWLVVVSSWPNYY